MTSLFLRHRITDSIRALVVCGTFAATTIAIVAPVNARTGEFAPVFTRENTPEITPSLTTLNPIQLAQANEAEPTLDTLENASVDEVISQAIADYQAGNYDLTIDRLNRAIDRDPSRADAYRYRGLAHHRKGDYGATIADYDRALALTTDPETQVKLYSDRGLAYYATGDYTQAIANYDSAIALNADYAPAYNHRGVVHYAQADYASAIADYDRTIERDADYAPAYNNRGLAYMAQGEATRAIANYTQAIRRDETYRDAYYNRGNAYFSQANYTNALADLDAVIGIDEFYANAYFVRAAIAEQVGDRASAMTDYQVAALLYERQGNTLWQERALDRLNLLQN